MVACAQECVDRRSPREQPMKIAFLPCFRGLALKEVIKSPEVDVGGLILSHESRAPSICTALCTARKIANIGILGRERTAVPEMIPTHERNGYVRADLGTDVPIHSAE